MVCKICDNEVIYCKGACKSCYHKEYRAKYNIYNKKSIKKYWKKYRTDNKEFIKIYRQEYYDKNKDKCLKLSRDWAKTNIGISSHKRYKHKRRALMKNSLFDLTTRDIDKIFKRDIGCVYCNNIKNLSLDHITPVSKGGDTTFNNMVLACRSCNSSKRDKNVFSWCKSKNIIIPKIVISLLRCKQ